MSTFAKLTPQTRQNLGVLFTAGLLFWASLASLLPTLPLYLQSIGAPDNQLGIVMGAFAIGLLIFRPQAGRMADQQGRKIVLLIGIAVATLAPICHLLTQSIPLLMLVRAFHGISIAALTTAYSSLVVDLAPAENRGELIGYMSLVNPIGMALGPALGGYLQELTTYGAVFVMSSLLGMMSLTCAMFVHAPPVQHQPQNSKTQGVFWRLLLSDRIRVPTITMLLVGIAFGAISTFIPLHIKSAGVELNSGLFYTAGAITGFLARFVAGKASDRYGRGRFITIGLLCYTVAMLLLWQANSASLFLLSAALQGFGGGTVLPIMIALVADRCQPFERGRIFGLFVGGFDLGIALAGPILGSVSSAIGYRGLYAVSSIVVFTALIVFMTLSSKSVAHSFRFALGYGKDPYAIPKDQLLTT
ncbi:MFS transporter [Cyanobacteria bacterium FACHB-DQ100]|nr:MFS transporter [Cyanobacteria bacterium FACHB-DQ100]